MGDENITTTTGQETTNTGVEEQDTTLGTQVEQGKQDTSVEDQGGQDTLSTQDKGTQPDVTVPETYDLTAPEGMEIDAKALESFTPVFKELKLSQEQVQKLVDVQAPMIKNIVDTTTEKVRQASLDSFKTIVEGWKAESLKELGTNSDAELALVSKARGKFGDKDFSDMLNETGIGNHPAMIRFLRKVGATVDTDKFPDTSQSSGERQLTDILYPSMKDK